MAVIGASADLTRMSGVIVDKLTNGSYLGETFPVNPKYRELHGRPCFPDVRSIGVVPDVAVVYLPAHRALDAARECAEAGVRGLIVISAGFAETGGEGVALQHELVEIVKSHEMALCGPNTAGLANFQRGFVSFGTSVIAGMHAFRSGGTALISSSGGLATSMLTYLDERRVGMSHLIGIGNEAWTGAAEFLAALVEDPSVTCILAVLEAIRDPDGFFAAADRARSAGKPVVVLKQGRSEAGIRAMLTHTGAMGGAYTAFRAACRAHGIAVVTQMADLADAAMMLTRVPALDNYRLGIMSIPGGGKSLSADAAADHGIELPAPSPATAQRLRAVLPAIASPENPLDPTAGFARDSERLRSVLTGFWSDDAFDVATLMQSATEPDYSVAIATDVAAAVRAINKPAVAIWESGLEIQNARAVLHDAEIPVFTSTAACFDAIALHRGLHRRWSEIEGDDSDFGPLADADDDWLRTIDLSAGAGIAVLDALGVRQPRVARAANLNEAQKAARDIGGPVAIKSADPGLLHKTEAGGVVLGVLGDDEIADAYARVARVGGGDVLVQEMIPAGVEMLVGLNADPQFGPILTVGYGGVATEVFRDVAHALAPVTRSEARSMVNHLRSAALLRGFRGAPARDEAAFVDVVLRLSWAAHVLRDRRPVFELNPVIVLEAGQGAVAVDCVIGAER